MDWPLRKYMYSKDCPGLQSTRQKASKTDDQLEVVHPGWVDQVRELLGGPKESEVETHVPKGTKRNR